MTSADSFKRAFDSFVGIVGNRLQNFQLHLIVMFVKIMIAVVDPFVRRIRSNLFKIQSFHFIKF